MKRGDVWTVAGGPDYKGKPRPAVVVQGNDFLPGGSVTVCPITTDQTDAALVRLAVEPSETNGLVASSRVMIDKVTTVPRAKIGRRVGQFGDEDVRRLNQALLVFLGLTGQALSSAPP